MPFAETWMQPEIIILSEVRKKDKFHTISLTCGIHNMAQMNISKKQKQTHRPRELTCDYQGMGVGQGREMERDGLGVWDQQMQPISIIFRIDN